MTSSCWFPRLLSVEKSQTRMMNPATAPSVAPTTVPGDGPELRPAYTVGIATMPCLACNVAGIIVDDDDDDIDDDVIARRNDARPIMCLNAAATPLSARGNCNATG